MKPIDIVKMKFLVVFYLALQSAIGDLDTTWWKHTTLYEVYLWSFKDSDGDGVGDIKGLTLSLDHFVDLGIETLYLTPFCSSPMTDMGYDITNFTEIDRRFGTMEDFDELIEEMDKRGLKLVMDIVINHSSNEHEWFQKSIDRVYPYTDYYVWKNAIGFDDKGKPIPPSNWISLFEGSAWQWNEKRKQFYYHQFAITQPDFDLRNKHVKAEIRKILNFWLEKGISGMRLDATIHYLEDEQLRNDIPLPSKGVNAKKYRDFSHPYTANLWESYEFIHDEIRTPVDQFSRREGGVERILIAEAYTNVNFTMAYYGTKHYPIMHFPFNFKFVGLNTFHNATVFKTYFHDWLDNMPKGAVANWVSENHDNPRVGNNLNEEYIDIILTTTMMAPGVACLYYGQEIGMTDNEVREDKIRDQQHGGIGGASRDPERLPMQWDDSINGGFSSKPQPWLPAHPHYWLVNVKSQKNTKISRYNLVKALSAVRKTPTLKHGNFNSYVISTWVYAFLRTYKDHDSYLTIVNLGTDTEIIDIHIEIPSLTSTLEIVASSINSGYLKGSVVHYVPKFPRIFAMRPLSVIVLKTVHEKHKSSHIVPTVEDNDSS